MEEKKNKLPSQQEGLVQKRSPSRPRARTASDSGHLRLTAAPEGASPEPEPPRPQQLRSPLPLHPNKNQKLTKAQKKFIIMKKSEVRKLPETREAEGTRKYGEIGYTYRSSRARRGREWSAWPPHDRLPSKRRWS